MAKTIACALGSCQFILDCASNCDPSDTSCINACVTLQPSQASKWDALETCMNNDCANACTGS